MFPVTLVDQNVASSQHYFIRRFVCISPPTPLFNPEATAAPHPASNRLMESLLTPYVWLRPSLRCRSIRRVIAAIGYGVSFPFAQPTALFKPETMAAPNPALNCLMESLLTPYVWLRPSLRCRSIRRIVAAIRNTGTACPSLSHNQLLFSNRKQQQGLTQLTNILSESLLTR